MRLNNLFPPTALPRPGRSGNCWGNCWGQSCALTPALTPRPQTGDCLGSRIPWRKHIVGAARHCRSPRAAAVRLLLARGASVNLTNNTGFTPVHHAIEAGAVEALAALLDARADLTIAAKGVTPMQTARRLNNANILSLLQGAGGGR